MSLDLIIILFSAHKDTFQSKESENQDECGRKAAGDPLLYRRKTKSTAVVI